MRAERRAMIALVAVFVLLVQALIPGLAVAAPAPGGAAAMICTDHGVQPAPIGEKAPGPAKSMAGGACGHCVCPPAVTALPPQIGVAVAYARIAMRAEKAVAIADRRPPTRAPPRPFGQGPPLTHA